MNNYFYPESVKAYKEVAGCFSSLLICYHGNEDIWDCVIQLIDISISPNHVAFTAVIRRSGTAICSERIEVSGDRLFVVNTKYVKTTIKVASTATITAPKLDVLPSCVYVEPKDIAHPELRLGVTKPFKLTMSGDVVVVSADLSTTEEVVVKSFPDAILSINGIYPSNGAIAIRGVGTTTLGFDKSINDEPEDVQ